jgi:uncharacterized Zn-finger protein
MDVLNSSEPEKDFTQVVDHSIPHFHNDAGIQTISVRVKEFMCTGASPPFDHPHIFIDMGSDNEAICSYCSTLYLHDPALVEICAPRECEYREVT